MARAGRFRERAAFEREAVSGRDRLGNPTPATWAPLATLWADLREAPGREVLAAGGLEGIAPATLRVRGSTAAHAITEADRVRVRGHVWAIVAPPVSLDRAGRVLEFRIERGGAVE